MDNDGRGRFPYELDLQGGSPSQSNKWTITGRAKQPGQDDALSDPGFECHMVQPPIMPPNPVHRAESRSQPTQTPTEWQRDRDSATMAKNKVAEVCEPDLSKKLMHARQDADLSAIATQAARQDEILASVAVTAIQVFVIISCAVIDFHTSTHLDVFEYGAFRDVSVMIFFGFGFLMTFLYRHGVSAVGYCLAISALTAEVSLVAEHWVLDGEREVTLENLLNALFCGGAVMISFGAVLGKVTPFQLVIMCFVETFAFWANFSLAIVETGAHDVGGGMVIHLFGAYFGLAVAWWVNLGKDLDHYMERSSRTSDIFSCAGTTVLWVLWPSFQAAVSGSEPRQLLAAGNTLISLCASTAAFAAVSRYLSDGKFSPVHLQNATLAGGVAMGVVGDVDMGIHGPIFFGFAAGVLSCVGYAKVSPWLAERGIHDTCGVNNLHGMPGIWSSVIGIVIIAQQGNGLATSPGVDVNRGFTGITAGLQLQAMLISLGLAIGGGILAGFLMTIPTRHIGIFVPYQELHYDGLFFEIEDKS